jgi:hypothetical protein
MDKLILAIVEINPEQGIAMADIAQPSIQDVESFAKLLAGEHPAETMVAFVLLFLVACVIGWTSKMSTGWTALLALIVLLFLVGAGGYAVYQIVPGANTDTAVLFKFNLEDHNARVESRAINTYVGGNDGTATRHRMIFRAKDETGRAASIRVTRPCPPNEADGCLPAEYNLPVWLLNRAEVWHFRNDGPGARVIVEYRDSTERCTIFAGPPQATKPKNFNGPDLCPVKEPPVAAKKDQQTGALTPRGLFGISTAWAADGPTELQEIRGKLASDDAKVRADGRIDLQKAPKAADLLAALLAEPKSSSQRDRIVANALITAIYFGDDKWPTVTPQTKTMIRELLVDRNDLVSRYARSVLRRYPEEGILQQVKTAAGATQDEVARNKLVIAASDIEYNLGVVRLRDARTEKNDMEKWTAAIDAFDAGIKTGDTLGDGRREPDVAKNYFGLALTQADKWTNVKTAGTSSKQVKDAFSKFLTEIDRQQYPYTDQVAASDCVVSLREPEDAQFEQGLGKCLVFFR